LAFKFYGNPKVYFLNFEVVNRHWRDQSIKLQEMWVKAIVEGYQFSAHNAFFERCIYENILVKRYGWPSIPFHYYRCTAAKAAACALPRNLEGAGAAMKLTTQKDKRGYVAMMLTCKPTKKWNAWRKLQDDYHSGKKLLRKRMEKLIHEGEPKKFLDASDNPEVWNVLYEYCKIDVRTEELLDQSLPDLNKEEQEIWFHNQRLNWRGLPIDIPTVKKIVTIMEAESKKKLKDLDSLTMGLVTKPGARKSILDFLALEGIVLPDIKSKTVDDAINGGKLSGDMKALLEIRRALSKTSTKKYQAFLNRAMPDGRCRDILLYHGASTGRDTGTGIQPHNFPRGAIKLDKDRPYELVDNVIELEPEMLQLLYGESLAVLFSSVLRNMIIPSAGKELFVADFSKIEVAVLWWLADNIPGLKVLRDGKDPYIYQAMMNTGKKYEDITEEERQLGKAQILGGGFGMGWKKFQTTAFDMYRLKLTDEQSQDAISKYRTANAAVPLLWKAYENAAISAIENPASLPNVGKCMFRVTKGFLWVQLPSGRRIAYREPQITMRETEWGPRKTLEFWAVNSKTKKWAVERTWGGTLTENIVQASARDLIMPAMVRLEEKGYLSLLMVHDEALCEKPFGEGSIDEFVKILCKPPLWAKGLPLEAKGWKGPRYRK
jgi:DNA polymerase